MVTKECIFCGRVLEKKDRSDYVCSSCQNKIKILSQIKKVDTATREIKKSAKRYLRKEVDYSIERKNIIDKMLKQGFVFKSTKEICFALQLEKDHLDYVPNYKTGKYKVDFIIPEISLIIEIDGELYHTNEDKDFIREQAIMREVGESYDIVRIPADYVPSHIIRNLREALKFVVDKRNLDKRFRDTRWDKIYFEEFIYLQNYLRKAGK